MTTRGSARFSIVHSLLVAVAISVLVVVGAGAREIDGNRVSMHYADGIQEWSAVVEMPDRPWTPGATLELPVSLQAHLPLHVDRTDQWDGIFLVAWGERLYDAEGWPKLQSNLLSSGFLTPSDLPVENMLLRAVGTEHGARFSSPIQGSVFFTQDALRMRGGRIALDAKVPIRIDPECPPGIYRIHLRLLTNFPDAPARVVTAVMNIMYNPNFLSHRLPFSASERTRDMFFSPMFTPPVQVGETETPRLPLLLFALARFHGQTGILPRDFDGRFAVSNRANFGADLVLPPGEYPLDLSPVTLFPQNGAPEEGFALSASLDVRDQDLDFTSGEVRYTVIHPSGKEVEHGPYALTGMDGRGVVAMQDGQRLNLRQSGYYRVRMSGWTLDRTWRKYDLGGTYQFWVGRKLSMSTAAKIGTSFYVGDEFPTKIQIHPMVPAYVHLTVRYFPMSDRSRERKVSYQGYSNPFGYFIPKHGERVVFDEPGEYAYEVTATYVDPRGTVWIGNQGGAGVVAQEDPPVDLRGLKFTLEGLDPDDPTFGMMDRFAYNWEAVRLGIGQVEFLTCRETPPPYHSGDVLHLPACLDTDNRPSVMLSMSTEDARWSKKLLEPFDRPYMDMPQALPGIAGESRFIPGITNIVPADTFYPVGFEDRTFQVPMISRHEKDWNPYNFPEGTRSINYSYFTAIRPGFPAFAIVTDSTIITNYWATGSMSFAKHFNAGPNGDLAEDLYRIDGGLVYKDSVTGDYSYAAYASGLVMDPCGSFNIRVHEAGAEPLLRVNGRDVYLFLAVEAGAVLLPGEPLALAAHVYPPVPADCHMEMTTPSGEVLSVDGTANEIGVFAKREGIFRLEEPGVYAVRGYAEYNGQRGGPFGVDEVEYYHFVVEEERPELIELGIPPHQKVDPRVGFDIPIRVAEGLRDPVLTWSVMCPGIIMDRGRMALEDGEWTYWFRPTQFAMQFPNYQIYDYLSGEPAIAKSTFLTFFVEGTDANGKRVADVKYVLVRGDMAVAPPTNLVADERSKAAMQVWLDELAAKD